ncbi:MAG: hypothetical protein RL308_1227, partial [Bacteroidota bacterium]
MKSILVLICFISISFGFSKYLNAQALSTILPKHQAYVATQTPVFKWNELYTALNYKIILSQDPTFTTSVIQSPILLSSNWTSTVLNFGVWFWKVVATTPNGNETSDNYQITIFDPSQVSNLSLWLKPEAGVVLDGFGKVQSWIDQSPNAYSLNQATPSKRPSVEILSLNNLPSIGFSGAQVLDGGDILDLGNSSRMMFVVGKITGVNQTLFAKANGASAPSRYALMRFGGQTTAIYQEGSDNHLFGTSVTTNFSIYSWENDRNSSINKLFINSLFIGTKPIISNYNFQSNFRFLIGAFNGSNDVGEQFFLNGAINEIIFVNSNNALEKLDVQNYLRYKYAPPVNLGKDTTKNNFCPINLTAPPGFTNLLWSTGATTASISANQAGQYWVQGTDIFGYVSRDTIQVNHPTILSPSNTNICLNDTITWAPQLGSAFTYLWNNGATTPSLAISAAGTYSVQVTDTSGCIKNSGNLN